MIDREFQPTRQHLAALAVLLVYAQRNSDTPGCWDSELLKAMGIGGPEPQPDLISTPWLNDLIEQGLVFEIDYSSPGWENERNGSRLYLTAAGSYYTISRAQLFAENWHGITRDFPDEWVDSLVVLQTHFAPDSVDLAPASDRFIRFDDNEAAFEEAIASLVRLQDTVRGDNRLDEIRPDVREDTLAEIRQIRELLEAGEGWAGKVGSVAWGVLGYLMVKFADEPIGFAAHEAWVAIKTVIGLA